MPDPTPARPVADPTGTQSTHGGPADAPATIPPDAFPFLDHPQAPDEIGRLGPYRVLGVLGRGGMGVVFRADDPALRRQFALKVMLPKFAADPAAKARFVREARAQAAVEHDHVITVYRVDEAGGVPYLAMPLLKGMTLADAIKTGVRCPVPEALRIAREMADGLAAAHEQGLVHRDIKPANVWLEGSRRRVKILDFGLARAVDEAGGGDDPVTASGAILGTPAYMSPEQANGKPLDPRTDLFSLGTVLYELLAGVRPFRADTSLALLVAVGYHTPPPPSALNPDVPPALDGLVGWLMAKDPAGRPPSADAAAAALRAAEADLALMPAAAPPSGSVAVALPEADPWAELTGGTAEASRPGHGSGGESHIRAMTGPARPDPAGRPGHGAGVRPRPWLLAGGVAALVLAAVAAVIVIKVTNPDGSTTEIKLPDGAAVEVVQGGKTVAKVTAAKVTPTPKTTPTAKLDPLPPLPKLEFTPVSVGQSPFDKLDPAAIPPDERFSWQPKEMVGLIGSHRGAGADCALPLRFSPDGRWLVGNNSLRIWDAKTLALRYTQNPTYTGTTFSADGRTMAVGAISQGLDYVDLFDLTGPEPRRVVRRRVHSGNAAHGVVLIPGRKSVAAGDGNGHLGIYDLDADEKSAAPRLLVRKSQHKSSATTRDLMVTPDGDRLGAVCLENPDTDPGQGAVRFWDISGAAAKELFHLPYPSAGLNAMLSPNGRVLLVGTAGSIEAHDVSGATPRLLDRAEWKDNSNPILAGFLSDGLTFRARSSGGMQLWQLAEGKLAKTRDLPPGTVAASDDLTRVVTRTAGALNLLDAAGTRLVEGAAPTAFRAFYGVIGPLVGRDFILTTTAAPPQRWEVRDGRWTATGPAKAGSRFYFHRVLSPDDSRAAVEVDGAIHVHATAGLNSGDPPAAVIPNPERTLGRPRWGTDNRTLFTPAKGGRILAWDTGRNPPTVRTVIQAVGDVRGFGLSPSGRHLWYCTKLGQWQAWLVDLGTGTEQELTPPRTGSFDEVAEFTPDGTFLAYWAGGGRLYRYRVADPAAPPELVLTPPVLTHFQFQFSRDGRLLVTGDTEFLRWYDATTTPHTPLGEWRAFSDCRDFWMAPDGRHVLVEQAGMLYVLRLAGGK